MRLAKRIVAFLAALLLAIKIDACAQQRSTEAEFEVLQKKILNAPFKEWLPLVEKAMPMAEALYGTLDLRYIELLNMKSYALRGKGHFLDAVGPSERVVELLSGSKSISGIKKNDNLERLQAWGLRNLATAYHLVGRRADSIRALKSALESLERNPKAAADLNRYEGVVVPLLQQLRMENPTSEDIAIVLKKTIANAERVSAAESLDKPRTQDKQGEKPIVIQTLERLVSYHIANENLDDAAVTLARLIATAEANVVDMKQWIAKRTQFAPSPLVEYKIALGDAYRMLGRLLQAEAQYRAAQRLGEHDDLWQQSVDKSNVDIRLTTIMFETKRPVEANQWLPADLSETVLRWQIPRFEPFSFAPTLNPLRWESRHFTHPLEFFLQAAWAGAGVIDQRALDPTLRRGPDLIRLHKIILVVREQNAGSLAKRLSEAEQVRVRVTDCGSLRALAAQVPDARFEESETSTIETVPEPTRSLLLAARDGDVLPPVIANGRVELIAKCTAVRNEREDRVRNSEQTRDLIFQAGQWIGTSKVGAAMARAAHRAKAMRGTSAEQQLARQLIEIQDLDVKLDAGAEEFPELGTLENLAASLELTRLKHHRQRLVDRVQSEIRKKGATDEWYNYDRPAPVQLPKVQALLQPDEALMLWVSLQDATFAFVATRENFRWARVPISRPKLAENIMRFRAPLERPGESIDLASAHELYGQLFGPLADLIAGKRHLILVPTDVLTSLPFNLLIVDSKAQRPDWLVRRHALSVMPSVAALTTLRSGAVDSRARRPFVGFGNPDFGNRSPQTPPHSSGTVERLFSRGLADSAAIAELTPLPETEQELREIAAVLKAPAKDVVLGREASESAVKALSASGRLADYRVIAFATHGVVTGEIKGANEPGIVLSAPATVSAEDDGLLTASEVAGLRIDADWVVLSACNTAAGGATAEGLSGLAQGFFLAGARSLLVSHWAVVSEAAVKLTTSTFAHLAREPRIGRAEALRRAMLELLDGKGAKETKPYYWAPFFVVGDGGAAH